MPKRAAGLTARQVQSMKTPGLFADGGGLYLQITQTGAKTWIYRFQLAGRRRDMGLGPLAVLSLVDARQKALECRTLVQEGIDPIERRTQQDAAAALEAAKAITFREVATAMIEAKRPGWSNPKHAAQWTSTLETYAYPMLGHLPVGGIDTDLVLRCLEAIWKDKTETASRLRGRIEAVLDYAKERGYRAGENPARWKGHLDHLLPSKSSVAKVEHHASLPYADMPAFWPRLQVQDGMGARALEFTILTAARTGEVLGATWDEIDLDARIWTVTAVRMKAGREHRVPLSDPAVALLRKLSAVRRGAYVFPGQRKDHPLSNMVMKMMLRRMQVEVTAHGFRSTFRTWAAEKTGVAHEVAEAALAHTQGDKVVAAYQRGDLFEKRRALMVAWAAFCEGKTIDVQR